MNWRAILLDYGVEVLTVAVREEREDTGNVNIELSMLSIGAVER